MHNQNQNPNNQTLNNQTPCIILKTTTHRRIVVRRAPNAGFQFVAPPSSSMPPAGNALGASPSVSTPPLPHRQYQDNAQASGHSTQIPTPSVPPPFNNPTDDSTEVPLIDNRRANTQPSSTRHRNVSQIEDNRRQPSTPHYAPPPISSRLNMDNSTHLPQNMQRHNAIERNRRENSSTSDPIGKDMRLFCLDSLFSPLVSKPHERLRGI